MAHKDRIAVILPVHNRREITLACLRQLQGLKAGAFIYDVIVVDDGSTDGTSEAVSRDFPGAVLLRGDGNLWWAGGVNKGMKYALDNDYDFVYIINDDIEMNPESLQILYRTLKKIPYSVCSSVIIDRIHRNFILYAGYNYSGLFKKLKSPLRGRYLEAFRGKILDVDCLSTKSVLIPMEVVRDVGFLDAEHFPHGISDYDYLLRVKSRGYRLLVNMDSRIYSGESGSNIHNLILNKSVGGIWTTLRSPKYRKATRAYYHLFTSRSGLLWGRLRFAYHMLPYFFWLTLKILLPKPVLKKILVKTGRIRLDEADYRVEGESTDDDIRI